MRAPTSTLLAIALAAALATACGDQDPVAKVELSVTLDEVFVEEGDEPRPADRDDDDDEDLVDSGGVRLGAGGKGHDACKRLPIYWLPTGPAETSATTDREVTICARMPRVRLGDWKSANGSLEIFESDGAYRVKLSAEDLVASSVYSAWLAYLDDGDPYAIAPLGGPPNLLLPDGSGSATLARTVPTRLLRAGSLLANGVSLDDGDEPRIRAGTEIQVLLYYHSDAQSNGNATADAPLPGRGRVGVPGWVGLSAHAHLVGSFDPLP